MTIANTIIAYLSANGPTSTRVLSAHIGKPPHYLSMTLSRLRRDQFIRVIGKDSHSNLWELGPRTDYGKSKVPKASKRGKHTTPKAVQARKVRREATYRVTRVEQQIKAKKRDHAARDKDALRDGLAADVDAYLARGGQIEEVPGYRDAPPVTRVRAYEGGWS